jgi:hypothetical protein
MKEKESLMRKLEVKEGAEITLKPLADATPIIQAFCDICSNQEVGTKSYLESRNWEFPREKEFCPKHKWE